mmetsp:Transcript_22301/g.16766  ORF Transcript_22301/g.16766 Transcript_22301/m.16766 type:complete len:161 (+) Transcript_22301:908-1390(+)
MNGEAYFNFSIPSDTNLIQVPLYVTVEYGGIEETVEKLIIIQNPDLVYVEFYPETGIYVDGLENTIFYAVFNNELKLDYLDFEDAQLVRINSFGDEVIEVESIRIDHIGKGSFKFVPQLDQGYTYEMRIVVPGTRKEVSAVLDLGAETDHELLFHLKNSH